MVVPTLKIVPMKIKIMHIKHRVKCSPKCVSNPLFVKPRVLGGLEVPQVTEEMDSSLVIINYFCAEVFWHFLLSPVCPEQDKAGPGITVPLLSTSLCVLLASLWSCTSGHSLAPNIYKALKVFILKHCLHQTMHESLTSECSEIS